MFNGCEEEPMKLDDLGVRKTFALGVLATAGLAMVSSCNDHPVIGFKTLVKVAQSDEIAVPDQPKIDMLWVVDNSGSMCQEQVNLARNFKTFADQLINLDADINLGVISTDARDEAHAGKLQNSPATENNASCEQPCNTDEHCGGGCLCGIPHVRQCGVDGDCEANEACVTAPGGGISHCAALCSNVGPAHQPTSDKCGFEVRPAQVLTCQANAAAGKTVCALTACSGDADCNNGQGQRCLPASDGLKYCRRFRAPRQPQSCTPGIAGQCPLGGDCEAQDDGTGKCEAVGECPPPTCDCPKNLPKVLNSTTTQNLERDFRCLATVGTKGDTFEKGLEAMRKALEPHMSGEGGPNAGFLREDAYLAVAILSDENDCSDARQTCEGPGAVCQVCTDDGQCRGTTEDDSMNCVEDKIDGAYYCRLPRREGNECEHLRDFLVPVSKYTDFLRRAKDDPELFQVGETRKPCSVDSDCLGEGGRDEGEFCSRKGGICLKNRVVMAGIVGPKSYRCVTDCPSPEYNIECTPTDGCPTDCVVELGSPDAFCADQVYDAGQAAATCTSLNGQAFNGRRYIDLINSFGKSGTEESICAEDSPTGEFNTALQNIARIIGDIIQKPFCLSRPLFPCQDHDQCSGEDRCLGLGQDTPPAEGDPPAEAPPAAEDQGPQPSPYCGDPDTRLPSGARVQIMRPVDFDQPELGMEPRPGLDPTFSFSPGTGPGGYGCFTFFDNPPGPGESALFHYRAGIVIDQE